MFQEYLSYEHCIFAASPYFSAPSRLVTVKKGDTAILHCDVNGDKPISVIWLRGGKTELNPSTNYRVNIKQDVTPEGVSICLVLFIQRLKGKVIYSSL